MLIQVLRLETEQQLGVYSRCYGTARDHSSGAHDPSPWEDGLGNIAKDEHCGFENAEKMRDWFHRRELDYQLTRRGIAVSVYEIDSDKVRRGPCQVVFKLTDATRVDRQPLENYP